MSVAFYTCLANIVFTCDLAYKAPRAVGTCPKNHGGSYWVNPLNNRTKKHPKVRVPTPPDKSWKVLDFFLKIPGPIKFWKFTFFLESSGNQLKVLVNPGKLFLRIMHFS